MDLSNLFDSYATWFFQQWLLVTTCACASLSLRAVRRLSLQRAGMADGSFLLSAHIFGAMIPGLNIVIVIYQALQAIGAFMATSGCEK